MLLFALPETEEHGARIAAGLGTQLSKLEDRDFGDGEYKVRPLCSVRGEHVCLVQSLYGDGQLSVHDKLCRLLFLTALIRDHGAVRVTVLVPYLAYGRKDRRTKEQDPLSTRYLAQLFEAMSCDDLITFGVHNPAAFENAFRIGTLHLELGPVFQDIITWRTENEPLLVMSPDPGGVKRAQLFREALQARMGQKVAFGFMDKRRSAGVMTHGELVGDYDGKSVVIVDDMISSGGTMIAAAEAAKARGANKVYALAAHGLFMPGAEKLLCGDPIERVFISDSIPPFRLADGAKTHHLEIIDTADEFAQILQTL